MYYNVLRSFMTVFPSVLIFEYQFSRRLALTINFNYTYKISIKSNETEPQ
jgi:hypothetical protein